MTLKTDTIYCGDNLDILKGFEDNSVDLCYIDPPFFTSKQYEVIWNDGAEIRSFDDRWVKMGEGRYTKDINVYLNFMEPRLREIHRVLKPTGSFYLHCDEHADAYLRVLCDRIFGYDNFINQIIWCYSGGGIKKVGYASKHDVIMFYAKDRKQTKFTRQYGAYKNPKATHSGGVPYREEGKALDDWWADISPVSTASKERLGWPTQKPESLLERVIKASSNDGDIVLDAFAGCGATLAVAKRLNRQFVGIDVSTDACHVLAKRIGYPISDIVGMPFTAEEIAALTGYQFQNAVIRLLDPSSNTIKVNNRGPDGGIDGSYFDLLISVKKYKAGRKDLDEFVATLYRNKKSDGMFIALEYSSDFTKEVARLGREQKIAIYPFTLAEIIAEKHKSLTRKEDKAHGKL